MTASEMHFYLSDSHRKMLKFNLVGGLIFLTIAIIGVGANIAAFGNLLPIALMISVLGFLQRSWQEKPIITIANNYLKIKIAPLASTHLLKPQDIQHIETEKKYLRLVCSNNKKVKLPYTMVNPEHKTELIEQLTAFQEKAQVENEHE